MILTSDSTQNYTNAVLIAKYTGNNGDLIWATKMSSLGIINFSKVLRNITSTEFEIFGRLPESNPKTIYQPDGLNTPIFSSTFDVPVVCNCIIKYTV